MENVFDFDTQLEIGNDGEAAFRKYYRQLGPKKSNNRQFDFVLDDGKTVELKTDTYDMDKTPNFFMEMFGDIAEGKIGGPWRALQDGVFYFVYYFPKNKTFFWFETVKLCKLLDQVITQMGLIPKEIRNKTWTARGYAVPRMTVSAALLRQDTF